MILLIVIFFIAIITAFGMLTFRAWEIRTDRVKITEKNKDPVPELYFRHVEKNIMHFAKHIIQWIVLTIVKYWLIITTKTKKWLGENWPKVHRLFEKKELSNSPMRISFFRRAILESKSKISKLKEKIKEDHE
jgi:hypothetical protein